MKQRGAALAPRPIAWVGSVVKGSIAEICATVVEEVAPLIVAAARGQLEVPSAIAKLRALHGQLGGYLDEVEAELRAQSS